MKNIYDINSFENFVAFDLETTGLSSERDGITQFGAVRVRNGKIADGDENRFDKLVFQGNGYGKMIPPYVERLTGITNEMVAAADPIEKTLADFMDFVGDDVLVGYNCFRFDCRFVEAACAHTGLTMSNACFDACVPAQRYIRRVNPFNRKYNLALICDLLGLTNESAHNAFYDAEATALVLIKLREKIKDKPQTVSAVRKSPPTGAAGKAPDRLTQKISRDAKITIAPDAGVSKPPTTLIPASFVGRNSDEIDDVAAQLRANYPDGVLPETFVQLSRECDLFIYGLRRKLKDERDITLEDFLHGLGYKNIPKKTR